MTKSVYVCACFVCVGREEVFCYFLCVCFCVYCLSPLRNEKSGMCACLVTGCQLVEN